MTSMHMEFNKNTLQKAIASLPPYEPDKKIWLEIKQELDEEPLQNALKNLSEYEPDEQLWELIKKKSVQKRHVNSAWWYAAALIVIGSTIGLWMWKGNKIQSVSYSEEAVDLRLQVAKEQITDHQYQQLKTYCESETLVCNSEDFHRLKEEYETLRTAAEQLQQAMGKYNTEPELIRQFSTLEHEKANILNEMAKMI